MAAFRGTIQGERGEASRLGHKGISAAVQSWQGAIETRLFHGGGNQIMAAIELVPHHGAGVRRTLFCGPLADLQAVPYTQVKGG